MKDDISCCKGNILYKEEIHHETNDSEPQGCEDLIDELIIIDEEVQTDKNNNEMFECFRTVEIDHKYTGTYIDIYGDVQNEHSYAAHNTVMKADFKAAIVDYVDTPQESLANDASGTILINASSATWYNNQYKKVSRNMPCF